MAPGREYLRKTEWILDEVSFTYLGGLYRGRGLLTWQPDAGFHLETFVTRSGAPLPPQKELVAAFAAALEKRGLSVHAYPGIKDWYDEIAQPLAELEAFLEHRSQLHPQILSIIVSHVEDQIALLKKMAGDIDEDWAVEAAEPQPRA
jgi:hypothetical protein